MIVILNRAAGADSENSEKEDEKIREAFAQNGIEIKIVHPDERRDLATVARDAVKSDEPVIVAGGGDGTISAVAGELVGSEKALGVLPLGTLNHFAKDLGLPVDLASAVAIIAAGHSAEVDVAEVNGRIFINNSGLGIYPEIVADREAQQEQLSRGKWHAFLRAALQAFRRFPFLHLTITLEGRKIARKTSFLFVGNNEYEIAGLNLGARTCMNAGKLGLYLSHRTGRLGIVRLAFRALFGRLEQAKDFDAFCVEEATIEARRGRLLVSLDGEVSKLELPLHYRIRPRALRVLVSAKLR